MNNEINSFSILNSNTSRSVTKDSFLKESLKGEFLGKNVQFSHPLEPSKVPVRKESIESWKIEEKNLDTTEEFPPILQTESSVNQSELVKFPIIDNSLSEQSFKMPKFVDEPKFVKMPNFVKMTKLTKMAKFIKKSKSIQTPQVSNIPRLITNYIASFLNTKKELFFLALVLNRCAKNVVKFHQNLLELHCFAEEQGSEKAKNLACQIRDRLRCFWTIAVKLKSEWEWTLILNWLKENFEFCQKVETIQETYHPSPNDDRHDLIPMLSLCKNLTHLKISDICWNKMDQLKISHGLTSIELLPSSCSLDLDVIKKVFPQLKFLKVQSQLSFFQGGEDINQETSVFKELTKQYSGISIDLRFNEAQLDTLIDWCTENAELLKNITVLNGAVCPLNKANKNKWTWLIEKLSNIDSLGIGSINYPFVINSEKSKIRKIMVLHGISKNLTLKNLPELERLQYREIKKSVTITLSGVPKLININGEIKRPLTAIEIQRDEKKIRQCKVIDEDFLSK